VPKRRDQIRMSEDEIWQLIENEKSLQVATLNRDGSPHLTTLWFAIVDRALVFETYTKSQKIRNLERDPRIAVLVEAGETYDQLRGVSINAKVELVTERDEVHKVALAVMTRNQPEIPRDLLDDAAKKMAAKRTGVVVRLEKVVSWDHRKLGGIGM
jgi:PPOX class probable F420-dependent enzyme